MFKLTVSTIESIIEMEFNDYTSAIGTFFTLLGTSILQQEEKEFILTLNNVVIREVAINEGVVVFDNANY